MRLETITPLILTYNEAPNIDRTLQKLTWASRIVVIDSRYSTDGTLDILQHYPQVECCQRKFDTHAAQWNYGLKQIDTEWVLSPDADYVLSDALIDELTRFVLTSHIHGYFASF
jgi:glycosyltransferase involved in cell wall biosynthesis